MSPRGPAAMFARSKLTVLTTANTLRPGFRSSASRDCRVTRDRIGVPPQSIRTSTAPPSPGSTVSIPQSGLGVQAGVQVSVPIFQGGRPAALQRQAQARSAAAQEQVIGAERDVIAQVRSAYSSWQASSEIISWGAWPP